MSLGEQLEEQQRTITRTVAAMLSANGGHVQLSATGRRAHSAYDAYLIAKSLKCFCIQPALLAHFDIYAWVPVNVEQAEYNNYPRLIHNPIAYAQGLEPERRSWDFQ